VVLLENAASIPRSQKILIRATCLSTDLVGYCVRISGSKTGSIYDVTKMDPTDPSTNQAVGIITQKYSSTLCQVQLSGPLANVYSSLVPGKRYWIDTDSTLTEDRPSPLPGGVLYLQLMGVALSDNEILISPSLPVVMPG
jgi:hypothetical protein